MNRVSRILMHKRALSMRGNLDEIFRDNMLEPESLFEPHHFVLYSEINLKLRKKWNWFFCKVAEYGFSMNPVSKRNSNDLDEVKSLYVSWIKVRIEWKRFGENGLWKILQVFHLLDSYLLQFWYNKVCSHKMMSLQIKMTSSDG